MKVSQISAYAMRPYASNSANVNFTSSAVQQNDDKKMLTGSLEALAMLNTPGATTGPNIAKLTQYAQDEALLVLDDFQQVKENSDIVLEWTEKQLDTMREDLERLMHSEKSQTLNDNGDTIRILEDFKDDRVKIIKECEDGVVITEFTLNKGIEVLIRDNDGRENYIRQIDGKTTVELSVKHKDGKTFVGTIYEFDSSNMFKRIKLTGHRIANEQNREGKLRSSRIFRFRNGKPTQYAENFFNSHGALRMTFSEKGELENFAKLDALGKKQIGLTFKDGKLSSIQ